MNNFRIDITSEGDLLKPMEIAFNQYRKAEAYLVCPDKGLIFFWHADGKSTPLPFKLDAVGAADFAKRWLAEQDYGPQPDHDGDNGKGWRVYNEAWGHVGGNCYAFLAVKPAWAMYGK